MFPMLKRQYGNFGRILALALLLMPQAGFLKLPIEFEIPIFAFFHLKFISV